jgi:hypothetical protein
MDKRLGHFLGLPDRSRKKPGKEEEVEVEEDWT